MGFNINNSTMVVTSVEILRGESPVLEVFHEDDEEGGSLWQFHSGSGNYSMDRMRLVRLDTVLNIDPGLSDIAGLAMGRTARRRAVGEPWLII